MKRGTRWQAAAWVLLASVAASSSGCLVIAGGAAASGAAGYAYYKGNVSETYDADFQTVWHASRDALYDMQLPIKNQSLTTHEGTIESLTAKGDKIRIHVELQPPKIPTDGPRTEVGVRVATFGDEEVSKRILAAISHRAGPPRVEPVPPPAVPAVPATTESVSSWKKTDGVQQASAEKK